MGTGLGHYIPIIAYLGFFVMSVVSLAGKPRLGLYYIIPFIPYRTMRDHFIDYPLGANVLTILVIAVILGGLLHGKHLPPAKLYTIWFVYGGYLYLSMWLGAFMGNAPAPLWLSDANFATWKEYMFIPLVFVAAGLVIEDRKAIRTVIVLSAISLFFIDRSSLLESITRNWTNFDESKRSGGPLSYGSNQTGAFLAEFGMLFWGIVQFTQTSKQKILLYGLVATTCLATMYTFSRGAYVGVLLSCLVLGILKDRKLLLLFGVFLLTWQSIVPVAVRERVTMTKSSNGQLEESAQERIDLWQDAQNSFMHSPIVGKGFATFQYQEHVAGLSDTHNWYVKVLVETGVIGFLFALALLQQSLATAYRLFRRETDPLYKGLGLGLVLAVFCCIVVNMFGDRWTYLEINGMLWVLIAAAARVSEFRSAENVTKVYDEESSYSRAPILAYPRRSET